MYVISRSLSVADNLIDKDGRTETFYFHHLTLLVFYCCAFYKFVCTYHAVWGYYYIIMLLPILVRYNGKHIFQLAEKMFKTWISGTSQGVSRTADGLKWDSFTYILRSIDTRNKRNCKQMLMGKNSS